MVALGLLGQIYFVSAGIGSCFFLISFFMGGMHHGGQGHGHTGHGHGGFGHGHGAAGHGTAGHGAIPGHGAASHGAIGHGTAGHGTAGHGAAGHGTVSHGATGHGTVGHGTAGHGAAGHGSAGHGGTAGHGGIAGGDAELVQQVITTTPKRGGHLHPPHGGAEGVLEFILGLLNPMMIASFLAFFGLTGLFCTYAFPWMGPISLAPALVVGAAVANGIVMVVQIMISKMHVTSAARVEDLVGYMAEVTVPISGSLPGEITYVVASKRYNSPAKSKDGSELKKGAKVMISEVTPSVIMVEPWTDSFVDPAFQDVFKTKEKETQPE